jgi:pimeloyl-ACP methyl ester carboxylesterase
VSQAPTNAQHRGGASPATPTQLLFLPGALGCSYFWEPVANLLSHPATRVHVGWPGFGYVPADSRVTGIDDLVAGVASRIDRPTALIAQSMGGVVAIRVALALPGLVSHLVLAATSGGIDVATLGGQDWRPSFREANPSLPLWFSTYREDLSPRLSKVHASTLLLWGDCDRISPVRVGHRLASLLPRAHLRIVQGGDHGLANTHAAVVAPIIDAHLAGAI